MQQQLLHLHRFNSRGEFIYGKCKPKKVINEGRIKPHRHFLNTQTTTDLENTRTCTNTPTTYSSASGNGCSLYILKCIHYHGHVDDYQYNQEKTGSRHINKTYLHYKGAPVPWGRVFASLQTIDCCVIFALSLFSVCVF